MRKFDETIRKAAEQAPISVPDCVHNALESALADLPAESPENTVRVVSGRRVWKRAAAVAACFVFLTLVLLPNLSVTYAKAFEGVPIIGDFVRVVTIRNYIYDDDRHELHLQVPQVEGNTDADRINRDVEQLTETVLQAFYSDLEKNGGAGFGSVDMDYTVVSNTPDWFTLKLSVTEIAASSNQYFKYYHIDKQSGKVVTLGDLFADAGYKAAITKELKRQMQARMDADETAVYWLEKTDVGAEFAEISDTQNFYWDESGDMVIVFDKYVVGPGSMGTPAFTVPQSVYAPYLKPEYA